MKRGIIVGDLHVGSVYGLLPPGFVSLDGAEINRNAGQRYLWDCWLDFCHLARDWRPDFMVLNGDLVEGSQRRQNKTECCLVHMRDQQKAAESMIKGLPKCPTYVVQGTEYHVGAAAEYEEAVAEAIGARLYPSVGSGRFCREVLWLEPEPGVLIECSHHISATTGFYRATALDRELQWSAMTAKDATKGMPKADLLVRSHVHYKVGVSHASKQGVVCPCWQLQTRYMRKHSVYRMLPDIGGLLLEVDAKEKERGFDPCRVRVKTYPLPKAPVTKL